MTINVNILMKFSDPLKNKHKNWHKKKYKTWMTYIFKETESLISNLLIKKTAVSNVFEVKSQKYMREIIPILHENCGGQ